VAVCTDPTLIPTLALANPNPSPNPNLRASPNPNPNPNPNSNPDPGKTAAERERVYDAIVERKEAAATPTADRQYAAAADDEGSGVRPVEYDQAFNYLNTIRMRFRTEERVYNAFLEILNMYRKGLKSISQVHTYPRTH